MEWLIMLTKKFEYLYKYRDTRDNYFLQRDLNSIKNNTFFAASREKLNDPSEGLFQQGELSAMLAVLQRTIRNKDINKEVQDTLKLVDCMGVFSLSATPLNELMWAHYGDGHHGFCVEYDFDLLKSFQNSHYSYFIEVTYQEAIPKLLPGHLFKNPEEIIKIMLGTKSMPWNYENEVRLVTGAEGPYLHDFRAVKCIYFGLRCEEEAKQKVMQELAGKNIKYKQVIRPEDSYNLTTVDIPDFFQKENNYMVNMANIVEGSIDPEFTPNEYKSYNDHLRKAAEIVRRVPYCTQVSLVSFLSNSALENPVIYVDGELNRNTPCGSRARHYFTIQEIDDLCRRYKIF